MSTAVATPERVALDLIDVGQNVRELDQAHVQALASSIALRGLIVPLVVHADGERFTLVAGYHRFAACRSLGLHEVEITLREQERSSADSAAENVVRKQLSPLEEARAVQHMLDDGYTLERRGERAGLVAGARRRQGEDPRPARGRAEAARQRRAARQRCRHADEHRRGLARAV